MAKVINTEIESRAVGTSYSLWQIALVGLVLGVLYWCLAGSIENYIIDPIFCRSISNAMACLNSASISGDIATILVATVGVIVILRLYMARPLVIALAVGVSLWGLSQWTSGLAWGEAIAWSALLYGLAYTLFSWIARYKRFTLVLIAIVLVIFAVRFAVNL